MRKRILIIGTTALLYLLPSFYFTNRYSFNTKIDQYDLSCKTKEEAEKYINNEITKEYTFNIKTKEHDYTIQAADIDLNVKPEINIEQNGFLWPKYLISQDQYELKYTVDLNEEKLNTILNEIDEFKEENMIQPQNAYISDYTENGYEIISETDGTYFDKETVIKDIKEKINQLEQEIDITDYYKKADITKDSPELQKELEKRNNAIKSVITYDLEGNDIVLNADTYHTWLSFDGDEITVNEELAEEYVKDLMSKTDTAYTNRNFVTADGRTVTVTGPYGYRIAKNDEKTQLINDILSGEEIKRKPVYVREGVTRNGNDYGNSYVEIDLTNQKVYLIMNGELIKSSSCVTGNVAKGYTTPPGIYPLTYKQKDAVLRGANYASPVKFWMPFNGGIGLHDASWRSTFGGTIYKTNGSHGCVNLPYDMAKTLYENVYQGMPIICYN